MEEPLFFLEIYPYNMSPNKYPRIVHTRDAHLMKLFLQQHGFNVNTAPVKIYTGEIAKVLEEKNAGCELELMKMGSRDSKQIFDIATSLDIFEESLSSVAEELSLAMSFGPLGMRNDLEIFKRVDELMMNLRYVYIKDPYTINESSSDEPYNWDIPSDDDSDECMLNDLWSDIGYDKIAPITLESYVAWFVKYIVIGVRLERMR